MWEETFICTLIFTGIFFIIPSIIRKRYFYIIVILGLCLYISSVLFIKSLRLREDFDDTSSGGYITREGGGGNPMFVCGTSENTCNDEKPYCSITERELPANTADQNIVFNTYARYVKIFPPATSGDGVVSISQIAIYDETGTNIALNTAPTGNCDTATTTPSEQLAKSVNGTMKPRVWPNLFSTAVTDRNIPSWSIDFGSKRMIRSIRYIGRGDYGMNRGEHQRNKGIRFRLYLNETDTPTTGTCTTTPDIIYPASITEVDKPIIAPLILKGYDGNVALNVYNKIKRNPPQDFSQYLTNAQAAHSYSNIYLKNLLTRKFGSKIKAKWDISSNLITVLSGAIPTTGMTIASSSNDGIGAVDEYGLPVESFPVGTTVTAVNGNIISVDKLSQGSGTNSNIKFEPTITEQDYNFQTFRFKNINSMTNWPSTINKIQELIDFKAYNTKTGTIMQKNPDGTAKYTLDSSDNKIFTPVEYTDDGSTAALTIIMDTTMTAIQDSAAGITALTNGGAGSGSGYTVKTPPNTFDWSQVSNSAVPSEGYNARDAVFDTNNEVTLIGVNTFNTSDENKVSLVAAQSAQISAGSGNESYAQDFSSIAKRTQLNEVFMLGDSDTFSSVGNAKEACQAVGADIADYSMLSNMVTQLSSVLNSPAAGTMYTPSSSSGTSGQYQKRPQWHEYGFFSDGTTAFPTQQGSISQLPGGQSGSFTSPNPNSKINRGGVVTASRSRAGAVCYGIKPSITPSTRTFDSKHLAILNQKGRYIRVWASTELSSFEPSFTMEILLNSESTVPDEMTLSTISASSGEGTIYKAPMNKIISRIYWEYDLGSQMDISTVQLKLHYVPANFSNNYNVEVAKAPRPQPFFQGYDDTDKKYFLWNDKSAFSPPCPAGLSDMICTNPDSGVQDLMCLPALPAENTSYSTGGIRPQYAGTVATSTSLAFKDAGLFANGILYGRCGNFILNSPTSGLPLRQTKCPMDCDPGATYNYNTGQCKYSLNNCDAWISMAMLEIDYSTYVSGTSFNGAQFASDYNDKVVAGNKAFHQYKASNLPGTVPNQCPPGKEFSITQCYEPCRKGYKSDGVITCWRIQTDIGVGKGHICNSVYNRDDGCCCAKHLWWEPNCVWWGLYWTGCYKGGESIGKLNREEDGGNLLDCPADHPDRIDGLCYRTCPPGEVHVSGMPYMCQDPSASTLSYTRPLGTRASCPSTRPKEILSLCYLPED